MNHFLFYSYRKLFKNIKESLSIKHKNTIQSFRHDLNTKSQLESMNEHRALLDKYGLSANITKNFVERYRGGIDIVFIALERKENLISILQNRGEVNITPKPSKPYVGDTRIEVNHMTSYMRGYMDNENFHPAKKESNVEAARKLVNEYFNISNFDKVKHYDDVHVLSITDPLSKNKIPAEYGAKVAYEMSWQDKSPEFSLANKVSFTNASIWTRLLFKPEVKGEVIAGQKYLICDDVITSGSTIKAYINHIEKPVMNCLILSTQKNDSDNSL
jgi:hypothetical protein